MKELIQNVEIVSQTNYCDYIKFKLQLPDGRIINLDQCRATYNFVLIPMLIIILGGNYEVETADKTMHQRKGFLQIYQNGRLDLLLEVQ